jgi:hypothetical protein
MDSQPAEPTAVARAVFLFCVCSAIHVLTSNIEISLSIPVVSANGLLQRHGIGQGTIVAAAWFVACLLVFLEIAAIITAFVLLVGGVLRRRKWARAAVLVLFLVHLPGKILWMATDMKLDLPSAGWLALLAADISVIVLLFTGPGGEWFAGNARKEVVS